MRNVSYAAFSELWLGNERRNSSHRPKSKLARAAEATDTVVGRALGYLIPLVEPALLARAAAVLQKRERPQRKSVFDKRRKL